MKKDILYISQVCYLDATLEYIKILSSSFNIHLLINISEKEKNENILNIDDDLNSAPFVISYSDISSKWNLSFIAPFVKNCISVSILNYKNNNLKNIYTANRILLKKFDFRKYDYIHFDNISIRQAFLLPNCMMLRSKIIMNVHDPKSHSGERFWYNELYKKVIYVLISKFITFSSFSRDLLISQLSTNKLVFNLKLLPYSIYTQFSSGYQFDTNCKSISFIGRLSKYKGVDSFLEAAKIVSKDFPEQKFIIAGKPVFGYEISNKHFDSKNIDLIPRHLSNGLVADIIRNSQLIVCPYKDATQSGVIMTSHALGKPVMVSNVGGLPEYIVAGKTGIVLADNNPECIAESILIFLKNSSKISLNAIENYSSIYNQYIDDNRITLNKIYSQY